MADITMFKGKYEVLSNFAPVRVPLLGVNYPTAEHAFQAMKFLERHHRESIRTASTPAEAKRRGRTLPLRADWERIKDDAMLEVLRAKFNYMYHPRVAAKLLSTGTQLLKEGNTWGDTYWGVDADTLKGQNKLGLLLMTVRVELKSLQSLFVPYKQ